MVHARVLEAYIHFILMYMTDHIFLVVPIKYLINKDVEPTTLFKLETGTKPSVSNLCVLFFPRAVQKATSRVDIKALTMWHEEQKGFSGIFVGIPQHQKGYLVYVPSTRKIISSYDVIFDESFSYALAYMSQPYSESMGVRPEVTYKLYYTSSKKKTGGIITLALFEEDHNDAESGDKFGDDSIMPPLLREEEMDVMDSGNQSDDDPIYM